MARLVRWNEIVFLLELCHDALSTEASDADNSVFSRQSIPDTQRIKEIETLIGSLLVDELSLDKPDAFGSIYALRPRWHHKGLNLPAQVSDSTPSKNFFCCWGEIRQRWNTSIHPLNPGETGKCLIATLVGNVHGNFSHFLPIFIYSTWHWENLRTLSTPSKTFGNRSSRDGHR